MHPAVRSAMVGAGVIGALVAGGATASFATSSGNSATTQSSTTDSTADTATTDSSATDSSATDQAPGRGQQPPDRGQRPDSDPGNPSGFEKGSHEANGTTEELLTGDTATKVTEAALAAVPGATVERVETDADGATYEAHLVTSDGKHQTVTFDANVAVVEIQDSPGAGGRGGGRGGPGQGHGQDKAAPADATTGSDGTTTTDGTTTDGGS